MYRESKTLNPIPCAISAAEKDGNADPCPSGYYCRSQYAGEPNGFCCSLQGINLYLNEFEFIVSAICPNEAEFIVDERTKMPKSCKSSGNSFDTCGHGFHCSFIKRDADGHCCRGTGGSRGEENVIETSKIQGKCLE